MSQDELFINGELLRLRREERGWVLNDMATRACMSVKQIRQLEEGGISAFYSVAVKVTAAKKVATLLGLSADEVFVKASAPEAEMPVHDLEASEHVIASEEVAIPVQEIASHDTVDAVTPTPSEVKAVDVASTDAAPKSKTSLLTIAGLFAVALAAAAYLQPKEEPAAETVPPVQVLPSDVADPASAASGSEPVASGVAEAPASVPATTAKPVPAATAASVSVAPVVAASVPRVAAPVASASMVTRPASAAVAVPATSAASKAP